MNAAAIVPAAGRGDRLAKDRPKAFVELGERTLLARVIEVIEACPDVEGLIIAAPEGWEGRAREIAAGCAKLIAVTGGGETRQASVHRAVGLIPEEVDAVVCHDAARPLASPKLFSTVLGALDRADGAVPALPASDTVKRVDGSTVVETVDRDHLRLVQTPQAFHREVLADAHRQAVDDGVTATDDAALVERAGYRVVVVPGEDRNIKVTGPEDLLLALALLRADA
jgi:2-C-methyl-D-erythritol 4-phosphate cytidylyltransferase